MAQPNLNPYVVDTMDQWYKALKETPDQTPGYPDVY